MGFPSCRQDPARAPSPAMNIPKQYEWLPRLRRREGLPRTISLALAEYGVREIVGRGSNATIIAWRDELNLAGVRIAGFSDDDTAWCGLFAAIVCYRRAGRAAEVVKEPLWARHWARYGTAVATRRQGRLVNAGELRPSLGDVPVFERGDGGHVGFYVGEDAGHFHVIGGNQGNRVSIMRMEKRRCLAVRRPPYFKPPASMRPFYLAASGIVSKNEA